MLFLKKSIKKPLISPENPCNRYFSCPNGNSLFHAGFVSYPRIHQKSVLRQLCSTLFVISLFFPGHNHGLCPGPDGFLLRKQLEKPVNLAAGGLDGALDKARLAAAPAEIPISQRRPLFGCFIFPVSRKLHGTRSIAPM